ncbi:MAG TPA: hypothetical protein PLJ35_08865 [Anaerolineae bacterium]|nr:hypothetical protein [Anaerolineae bacterium]HOQ98919.1 hypothetical protein [Anaerolineae bacterium]HPL26515.1 hypothetical protein [Anaerolineae bacterium]
MKIAFVGGGSLTWAPELITDLALMPEVHGAELVLQDIDPAALERMLPLAELICRQAKSEMRVSATLEREPALTGADYVIYSVAIGGLRAVQADLEIPARYGVRLPVGMNVGPAGISRALRHIPATVELCRQMERSCPEAWLINLTNPMTQLCWVATRETSIRTIGLCHEITHFAGHIAGALDVPPEEVCFQAAGINHLPWVLEFRVGARDGLALLRDWLAEHGALHFAHDMLLGTPWTAFHDRHGVKFTIFEATGCLPGAGDRHVAEFFPHFLRPETNWGLDYGIEATTVPHRAEMYALQAEQVQCWLSGEDSVPLRPSPEQVGPLVAALAGGRPERVIVNIPNLGQVPNLPRGAVVECYARVDARGVHPEFPGPLPAMPAAVCNWHLAIMELTLEAALCGDRGLALEALRMEPTVREWEAAAPMLDELLAANATWLPQFQ